MSIYASIFNKKLNLYIPSSCCCRTLFNPWKVKNI